MKSPRPQSSFRPCLLIPIYNHKEKIGTTLDRLAPFALPIFVVDDGSDAETRAVLDDMQARHPGLTRLSLPVNSGKGAAVMHGMRAALAAGFSHALQIDADGQHDTDDVPRFLALAENDPETVVCGRPIYDESVPKGRLYGRYVTHVWVWIETLSFAIGDSMCGFRLYPLRSTCALIDEVPIPKRMDFDIEIIVRLAWRGLRIENVDTRVTYPPDGVSHFDLWRDNVRISRMHARLFFAMLPRLPALLWRRFVGAHTDRRHWSRLAERGSALGLAIVFACYRLLGARAARLLLYPIVAYFFLTAGQARAASLGYLRRVARQTGAPPPRWRDSFRHMMSFARSGLDKMSAWMGALDSTLIDFPNHAEFKQLIDTGVDTKKGALLIGSHLGNLEITRALATVEQRARINAVVYTEHAQRFNRLLSAANAEFGVNLLQVSHFGPETAILLRDKVDQGELLVIVGDRTPPAENGRVGMADFLGAPAPFAHGPFVLASLLECPVYLFFCLREGERYRVHLEPFAKRVELPRRERRQHLDAYLQCYARRLEAHCLQAPEQWFNFFDFWHDTTVPKGQI